MELENNFLDNDDVKHEFHSNKPQSIIEIEHKCGEVFINNDGKISYYCIECTHLNFETVILFEKHLIDQHFIDYFKKSTHQKDLDTSSSSISDSKETLLKIEINPQVNNTKESDGNVDVHEHEKNNDNVEQDKNLSRNGIKKTKKINVNKYEQFIKLKGLKKVKILKKIDKKNIKEQSKSNHMKAFPCSLCERSYSAKKRLKEHYKIHNAEDRLFKCDECGKCLRSSTTLKLHMRIHTDERPFACEICQKAFRAKPGLMNHMLVHTGEKPFPCTFCVKRFQTKAHVRIHERIHTGEKPYQCDTCGKNFASSSRFNEHQKRHLNIRAFPCEDCGKSFFNNQQLSIHKIVHTKEKNFICEICSISFGRKRSLRQHERIHSGTKDYICNLCGEGFLRYSAIYYHMKSQHEFAPMEYTYNPVKYNNNNLNNPNKSDAVVISTAANLSTTEISKK